MDNLILLNAKSGMGLRWAPPANLSFLKDVALLPIQAVEAGQVASALPIALVRDVAQPSGWSLMAVCGRDSKQNLMVDGEGRWSAAVLPDSARYLPFALKSIGGDKALAGIDPRYAGNLMTGEAATVPLYDESGVLHQIARNRVSYLTERQPRLGRTQAILSALKGAGLIKPWPNSVINTGSITIKGLHTIDEKKLAELEEETFLSLRKSGALTVAYSCLLSLYQVRALVADRGQDKPVSDRAVQTTGDLDLEFLKDDDTIKFGPLS